MRQRSRLVHLALRRAMFAVAPWIINAAPYESTMGLVQKIFYFHLPSAIDVPAGGDRLRRRQRALPVRQAAERGRLGAWPRPSSAVLFGALTLVTGPLWARKAWGVWWVWDAAADVEPAAVDDLRRLPAAAAVSAGPDRTSSAAGMALFGMANVPFIYVSVNVWRTLHPADLGGADAAGRHGHSAVVLLCRVHDAVPVAADAARARSNASARASKRCILPRTKRDAISPRIVVLSSLLAVPVAAPASRSRSRSRPRSSCRWTRCRRASRSRRSTCVARRLRVRLGRGARLRVVDRPPAAAGRSGARRARIAEEVDGDRRPDRRALHLHSRGAADRRRDRLDSRLARRAGRDARRN